MKQPRASGSAPTIFDVARESGFSAMTVSRVVNKDARVKESTRAAVQAVVDRLQYAPNPAARSLAGVEPTRIGLLYSNPSSAYLSQLLIGALAEARARHAMLLVEKFELDKDAAETLPELLNDGVDGIILSAPLNTSKSIQAMLEEREIPAIAVADTAPRPFLSCVKIDDYGAARQMTRQLIELGHRRIGFIIGDQRQADSHARLAGFRSAMAEAGIEIDEGLVVAGAYTYQSGMVATEQLLSLPVPPTAIFASNDDMAVGALAVAHRHHLDVPEQLSICGFDDTELSQSVWPPLTTVHQPIADMAQAAVGMLVDQIGARRRGTPFTPRDKTLGFSLLTRESVAPPPKG
ncbi:LacI family DNA-binding transcriptional regulator [Sphingomonas sp. ASV193]|uniref:LacI family DNA-binding transcriptional regulator n=1 Tax=Sphingomonas sp. ASV193 TaxID=3144405 RepID=UPI0032E8A8BA